MAVVALEAIAVGDEVLLDYGADYWHKLASCSEDESKMAAEDETLGDAMQEQVVVETLAEDGSIAKKSKP